MSIFSYNGGCAVAMKGKNCVAIASDVRFGVQLNMISKKFEKIFQMGPKLFIGLVGLATDIQTVHQKLKFRVKMYEMGEGRKISPHCFMAMVQNLLYERRFGPYFVEPIIAGLDDENKPFICGFDTIGCATVPGDFVSTGTCDESILGMAETVWNENMDPEQVFESISQTILNASDRDAVCGYGAVVHIIESNQITTRTLKARQD